MQKEDFITPKELAIIAGKNVRTIKRWIRAGKIPIFQPAGPRTSVLIPKAKLRLDMLPTDFLTR